MQGWALSALRKATPSNWPLLPSMHCTGNFVPEFPSINSPILTLTHARAAKVVVCSTDLSCLAAWVISFWNFLADDKFGAARACATVRIGKFMLGNSRMKLPDAMHAGQERSVQRDHGLAASAAPVITTASMLNIHTQSIGERSRRSCEEWRQTAEPKQTIVECAPGRSHPVTGMISCQTHFHPRQAVKLATRGRSVA